MDDTKILTCKICGGIDFSKTEGFYYCKECGTQSENVRDIEIEDLDTTNFSKTKIKKTKKVEVELTTWECFNYYLKGLVDELITLGAKEELKLKTLQLWATYLRKSQVAFFNKTESELPKLGPCFDLKDAKILYNHELPIKKAKQKVNTSICSGRGAWKRQKKKYAQSEYSSKNSETQSQSQSIFDTSIGGVSSSSATINRPTKLTFSTAARKHFKKQMPTSHLKKHAKDDKKELTCHSLGGKKSTLTRREMEIQLSRKTIYTLLYIALNLIEDDIQLCDMMRFLHEGHLSITKIRHFFPENVAEACEKMTNSKQYHSKRCIFLDSQIRFQVVNLCKFIHIPELNTPNIDKLVERYCKEFSLPEDFYHYAERLIILSKPEMKIRFGIERSPHYEGRAMAYIIFIFKLLFGIDDYKETLISESAKTFNEKTKSLKIEKLFVWSDWVKYIEMRKIILAQCHTTSSYKYKKYVNRDHYIDQIVNESKVTNEDVIKLKRTKIGNLNKIFENFSVEEQPALELTEFPPTLYPQTEHLKEILRFPPNEKLFIPEFMHDDFTKTNIHTFLNPKQMKLKLKKFSIKCNCIKIDCNPDRNYFKIFRKSDTREKRKFRDITVRKVDFNIDEVTWLEEVHKKKNIDEDFLKPIEAPAKKKIKKKRKFVVGPKGNLEDDYIFEGLSDFDDNTDDDSDENIEYKMNLKLTLSSFDYWTLFGKVHKLTDLQFGEIKYNLPNDFVWLMETFSDYLGIDMHCLYEEVITLENYFLYVLDDLENLKNVLIFKPPNSNRELATLINYYKSLW